MSSLLTLTIAVLKSVQSAWGDNKLSRDRALSEWDAV